MNKYETMRRIICGLFIWNLLITAGMFIDFDKQIPTPTSNQQLNEKICELEAIPEGELL